MSTVLRLLHPDPSPSAAALGLGLHRTRVQGRPAGHAKDTDGPHRPGWAFGSEKEQRDCLRPWIRRKE